MSEAIPLQPEPHDHDSDNDSDGQVSEAGSAFSDTQTAGGGADAVPDTPDAVPADDLYTD